jgi:predicted transcriptional regulator
MSTITARISNELDEALTKVAKSTERSKSFIISKAIQNYVLGLQEDIEDCKDATEILAQNNSTYTLEEIERKYGLED